MQLKLTVIKITAIVLCVLMGVTLQAQAITSTQKFSPAALKQDLAFIKQQVFVVQANAFTELTKQQYEKIFTGIEAALTDSLTAIEFYRRVKPVMAWLSDEHSDISLPKGVTPFSEQSTLLPFTLKKQGNAYVIDTVLLPNSTLAKGIVITRVNNVAIEKLIKTCAEYTTGFPTQRTEKAFNYFGYLYSLANPVTGKYVITSQNGKKLVANGASYTSWLSYIAAKSETLSKCTNRVTYQRFGQAGYINACSFSTRGDSDFTALEHTINGIFEQIQKDSVGTLVIDVSKNSGGNSAVGNVIINNFYDKPYRTYQCNWKRSDEYLQQMKKWGSGDDEYEKLKPGEIMHYDSDTVWPSANNRRFKGKVYVLISEGTFSSAMMFATIIKDNGIATLVGKTPHSGHPTHFGELYATKTPNTQLSMRFGVKEWIRPAGKTGENILEPDIEQELGTVNIDALMNALLKR